MFRQIGQKPPSDFGNPVGMLEDCHQRIRFFLGTLVRFGLASEDVQLKPESSQALRNALMYFRNGAPKHTLDEEESLFPRLRKSGDPRVPSIEKTLRELEHDHAQADAAHAEIDALGEQWLAQGSLSEEQRTRWLVLAENLQAHYERHIAVEERDIFTAARQILTAEDQRQIGAEMARRRGMQATAKL
jgi:hemerythrin-like domain-containing protein